MAELQIGNAVRRTRKGSRWHLVESVVADAAITRCGRRLEPRTKRGQTLEVMGGDPGPILAIQGDDGCAGCR